MKRLFRERVDLERHFFADLDVANVRFVGLGVNLHFLQVLRDGKNRWCLQRCRHGLADIHVARDHRPINRRTNHRVIQIRLSDRQCGFFLADLSLRLRHVRLRAPDGGIRGIVVGLRHVQLLLAHNTVFGESDGAIIVGLRLHQRCPGFF